MCVLGAVWTDKVIVQALTDYIWLGGDHYDIESYNKIGRLFLSLRKGLKTLNKYYRGLSRKEALQPERMYPYIRSFFGEGKEVSFSYIRKLPGRQPIFLVRLDDGTLAVVKFVQTYSSAAQNLLASHDFAPRLLYCGVDDTDAPFFGRLKMVVMEYIEGETVYDAMLARKLGQCIYESVGKAVNLLHENNFVFGDLRAPNIILNSKDTVMLVDFDWCSIDGQGRYPPNLNKSATKWHESVRGNGVMRKAHDIKLLEVFHELCV
jgi:serine/threonine protein kinase